MPFPFSGPRMNKFFKDYIMPGHRRQSTGWLKNTVERLVYLSDGGRMVKEMLPPEMLSFSGTTSKALGEAHQQTLDMELITLALRESNNNYTKAAKKLGISRATLYRKLKKRACGPT
ncbi:MAG: helix-turn-helix domain-containing protein [Peptococcaceae bacterium]|nr:helix-turn-helix domain-containing protein [Peptococcaceae bacterium]